MDVGQAISGYIALTDRLHHLNREVMLAEKSIEALQDFLCAKVGPRYDSAGRIIAGAPIVVCGDKALRFSGLAIFVSDVAHFPVAADRQLPAPVEIT